MPTPGEPTSMTLLQRLRGNDPAAWQRLLQLYVPLVVYWCQRWGVRGDDADDVAQEVFQAVAASLADFRHDRPGDTFRGWLRGITRFKVLDHRRRRDRQPEAAGGTDAHQLIQQVPDATVDEADEPAEIVQALYRRALELIQSEFAERTWQMFWRAAVEQQPPDVIAAALGVGPAAVRQAKSRVLRRLKEELGDVVG